VDCRTGASFCNLTVILATSNCLDLTFPGCRSRHLPQDAPRPPSRRRCSAQLFLVQQERCELLHHQPQPAHPPVLRLVLGPRLCLLGRRSHQDCAQGRGPRYPVVRATHAVLRQCWVVLWRLDRGALSMDGAERAGVRIRQPLPRVLLGLQGRILRKFGIWVQRVKHSAHLWHIYLFGWCLRWPEQFSQCHPRFEWRHLWCCRHAARNLCVNYHPRLLKIDWGRNFRAIILQFPSCTGSCFCFVLFFISSGVDIDFLMLGQSPAGPLRVVWMPTRFVRTPRVSSTRRVVALTTLSRSLAGAKMRLLVKATGSCATRGEATGESLVMPALPSARSTLKVLDVLAC
jgi:hypothetical protein